MIFGGIADPFCLGPEGLDEVHALAADPLTAAVEGLEYLEHHSLTNPFIGHDPRETNPLFRPLVLGLGFGVRLSLELLNITAPDCDVSEYLTLYETRIGRAAGAHVLVHEIADIAPNALAAVDDAFDPNVARYLRIYSFPALGFTLEQDLTFMGAAVYGQLCVREAFNRWEINHPVAAAERAIAASSS